MLSLIAHLVPAALAAGAAWVLLLLVHPVHRCPCKGRKAVPRGRGFRPCRRCQATGRAYRLGARTAHRAAREYAWPWLRDRVRAAAREEER